VVSPDDMVARYGADATRMYALFAAPPDRDLDWQEDGVAGVSRFLGRVYRLAMSLPEAARKATVAGNVHEAPMAAETKLLGELHRTIAKITNEFGTRWHFNTCIASIMTFVNHLQAAEADVQAGNISEPVVEEVLRTLVLLIAPFAPFLSAELWKDLGGDGEVLRAPWPVADPGLAKEDEIEIPVQVNGKLRSVIKVAADIDQASLEAAAKADEKVQGWLADKRVVKVIVAPGKLVNLVVK